MTPTILLALALLFQPFTLQSADGFVIEHNGAVGVVESVDRVFPPLAARWRGLNAPTFAVDAAPIITRVVILPMAVWARGCDHAVRWAVVPNGGFRGYTVVVDGGIAPDDLDAVMSAALWMDLLVIAGMAPPQAMPAACVD